MTSVTPEQLGAYIDGRGGHDSQCCVHRLGYGCNCRVAEWRDAFTAGYAEDAEKRIETLREALVAVQKELMSERQHRMALQARIADGVDGDELREKVARAMEEADTLNEPNRLPWQDYAHMADAAISVIRKEMGK